MKSKSIILLVFSIGFGIVAAIGISQVMNRRAVAGPSETPHGPVLLASADLGIHEKLTEENVKLENWALNTIPPDAITSLEDIADMVTTTRMSPGIPIVRGAIEHKSVVTRPDIPPNMKVVAVRVAADDTIGNLLRPGHKVDVIGVFKARDQNTGQTTTNSRTFLKALDVYSIGNKTTNDSSESANGNSNASSIVGLLVTQKQSEALVFVQDTGSIKLVLRGDDAENNGEVGELEDLQKQLASRDSGDSGSSDSEIDRYRPTSVEMVIFRGSDPSTTKFSGNGAPIRQDDGSPAGGSSTRKSSEEDYEDSKEYGSGNRGIDDDQYPGE